MLYLDAESAFDNVVRQLLVRKLFLTGTTDQSLLFINQRLENRNTYLDWDKKIMGPIYDEKGVEQGGVNSDHYYKIFGKEQLSLSQDSNLGVSLHGITISAIGQADDTVLVSNSLQSIQNLLDLSLDFCRRNHVSLCIEKTKLQGMGPQSMAESMRYMKMTSHVNIKGTKLDFADEVEHVGIIRSVHGNNANLLNRISSHKKAIGAVLHNGMARNHRGNPAASVSAEKLFGASVLFSGLGSLVLKNDEIDLLDQYYSRTLQNLMRLRPNTPRCVTLFLASSLPGRALLHLRQFSLFSMLIQLDGKSLKQLVIHILTFSKPNSNSWFHQLRKWLLTD